MQELTELEEDRWGDVGEALYLFLRASALLDDGCLRSCSAFLYDSSELANTCMDVRLQYAEW